MGAGPVQRDVQLRPQRPSPSRFAIMASVSSSIDAIADSDSCELRASHAGVSPSTSSASHSSRPVPIQGLLPTSTGTFWTLELIPEWALLALMLLAAQPAKLMVPPRKATCRTLGRLFGAAPRRVPHCARRLQRVAFVLVLPPAAPRAPPRLLFIRLLLPRRIGLRPG